MLLKARRRKKATRSSKPKLRTHPKGELPYRIVGLGRDAGQELEDVLHVGVDVDCDINFRLARPLGKPLAVVEQRLVATDLNVDRWQALLARHKVDWLTGLSDCRLRRERCRPSPL